MSSFNLTVFVLFQSILLTVSTNFPVIGILSQEYAHTHIHDVFPNYTSYIAASYIKQVEATGARVVPILIGKSREYYAEVLANVNGVLLPGGAALFNVENGYAEAGRHIFHFVKEMNEQGEYIPILGVCLGFELLIHLSNDEEEVRRKCNVQNVNLSLEPSNGYRRSSIFSRFPEEILDKLIRENLTHNNHVWCIEKAEMKNNPKLNKQWKILSNSKYDIYNFVSTVEHKVFPFVGLQYHPEKNAFEWTESQHNVHNDAAVQSARYFYDWLTVAARKNSHSYPDRDTLYKKLIQNYPHFVGYPHNIGFEQIYFFE